MSFEVVVHWSPELVCERSSHKCSQGLGGFCLSAKGCCKITREFILLGHTAYDYVEFLTISEYMRGFTISDFIHERHLYQTILNVHISGLREV